MGVDYTFNAMAAIVIGGTPFIGGKGGIGGTILGALLMKILASGLSLVGIPATWQKAITGFVIVALIIIDVVNDQGAEEGIQQCRLKRKTRSTCSPVS